MKRTATLRLTRWRERALRSMERSRATTLGFLGRLPERAILEPRSLGKWSVKDTFAHFAAWEEEGARRLRLIARGRGDRIVFYNSMRQADLFNARAVCRARTWSWKTLLRRAARVRRRLIETLRRLPPASLKDPTHRYPVTAWLPEFAWTHEQGHLARIRNWWSGRFRKGKKQSAKGKSEKVGTYDLGGTF